MAYGVAKLTSRNPNEYGKGSIDGVAAPEAANNSASTGAMLPMMTLGIPGSPTTAVLLAGMVIWGLQPGPLLFTDQPDFVHKFGVCLRWSWQNPSTPFSSQQSDG